MLAASTNASRGPFLAIQRTETTLASSLRCRPSGLADPSSLFRGLKHQVAHNVPARLDCLADPSSLFRGLKRDFDDTHQVSTLGARGPLLVIQRTETVDPRQGGSLRACPRGPLLVIQRTETDCLFGRQGRGCPPRGPFPHIQRTETARSLGHQSRTAAPSRTPPRYSED